MIILDQIEKLINEHGSAAILRDHLAFFKDQVLLTEAKITDLTNKVQMLDQEKAVLNAKVSQLTKDNEELRSKVKQYEEAPRGLQTKAESDFDVFNH